MGGGWGSKDNRVYKGVGARNRFGNFNMGFDNLTEFSMGPDPSSTPLDPHLLHN